MYTEGECDARKHSKIEISSFKSFFLLNACKLKNVLIDIVLFLIFSERFFSIFGKFSIKLSFVFASLPYFSFLMHLQAKMIKLVKVSKTCI